MRGLLLSWQAWALLSAAFAALRLGQAAQVAPIDKLSVLLVALFGVLFLGERLPARTGWG